MTSWVPLRRAAGNAPTTAAVPVTNGARRERGPITCSSREIIMIARRGWDLRPYRLIDSHPKGADAALHIGQKLNVLSS